MTQGWGEIALACRVNGALAIHLEYENASTLFFKVFDVEGHCLECCPGRGRQDRPASSSSSSSSDAWESNDSPELYETPETSDDSYVPPSSGRA